MQLVNPSAAANMRSMQEDQLLTKENVAEEKIC